MEFEQCLLCFQLLHQGLQLTPPVLTVLQLQLQVVLCVPLSQELAGDVLAGPRGEKQEVWPGEQGPHRTNSLGPSQWSVMMSTAARH